MKERFILMSSPMVLAMERDVDPKSQTRRIVDPQPEVSELGNLMGEWLSKPLGGLLCPKLQDITMHCPYGQPGDILLIKESAWMWCERVPNGITPTGRPKWHYVPDPEKPVFYVADCPKKPTITFGSLNTGNEWGWRFKVGRFLPRWAIRIKRVVTNVRVERLQDISEEDAIAEGVNHTDFGRFIPNGKASLDGGKTFHSLKPRQHFGFHVGPVDHPDQCHATARGAYGNLWETINGAGSWGKDPYVWVVEFQGEG